RRHIFREFDVLEEWLGLGRPALRRTLPWLGATLALGLMFLAGQIVAWRQLTAQGFAFNRWASPGSCCSEFSSSDSRTEIREQRSGISRQVSALLATSETKQSTKTINT